jgi:hypothetical protein
MAGDSVIGALRVVLGADTAAFESGLKSASKDLEAFQKRITQVGTAIGTALGTAVVALGISIRHTLTEADKLGKMAQSIGIPVEELSRLKHAADLSDVSMEALGKSVGILSRNMVEAATNAISKPALAFKALQIEVRNTDGSLKSASQIVTEVAGRFGNMQDGAGKTALAMALFGRAGAAMIPMLNAGAKGLRDMMHEADELGIVIDQKTAKAAEDFNDNLTRLGKVKDAIVLKITAQMLPALRALSEHLIDAAKNSNFIGAVADGLITAITGVVRVVITAGLAFQRFGAELVALWAVLMAPNWADMKARWSEFRAEGDKTEEQFASLSTFMQNFWTNVAATTDAGAQDTGRKLAAPIMQSTKSVADSMKAMKDAARAALDEIVANPIEPTINKLNALRAAVDAGTISWTQYGKMVRQVNKDQLGHLQDLGTQTASTLTTVFKNNKAASIAAAIINTAVAITKALSQYPPPISFAMAGLQAAAGAAQIAAIKSTKMAKGGSFTVPGGMSMTDNTFVPLNLASGERVTVEPAGQVANDPLRNAAQSSAREVMFRVDEITRPLAEKIAPALSSLLADRGITFKVA